MRKSQYPIICLHVIFLLAASCFLFEEKPQAVDGNVSIRLRFTVPAQADTLEALPVPGIPVRIYTEDYSIPELTEITDSSGFVRFDNLPYARYVVESHALIKISEFEEAEVVGAKALQLTADSLRGEMVYTDTLLMEQSKRGLKINEIYTAGPPNNIFYFYDQFMELYNGLSETVYLDGMIILRLGTSGLFADTLSVTYIYQFPGTPLSGRQYPVEPGQFVVIAGNAFDHNTIGPIAGKTVDLSNADWEFVNLQEANGYDNPNVPNITTNNGRVTQASKVDFLLGLTGDGLALCDGSDYDQTDGIDIRTVIDCVESSSSPTHIKEVPYSLDASFGGIGMQRYSGQSLERIRPGFDTNNSAVDFVVISKPTPGYHHE
ncbi:MAG: DUF4876 domain-containing protein [Candidatus Neomarinimicrobiota bacterium]|jgi:hypothetical protein|nr:DUF4876 domain-containing protein [Candidatus Neomarinimicrobiota bacterium]MDD4961910.1 DUF4876 domain-containing protein [Candidatus Neomarinimicrobiota bacterium]MDD5710174.1 DUF4876 domain-containing protein [Candidatus Neomarinimicrobiota bacterium]MDX9779969.1 DUF4876 domain-containing protein [bacterium]